MLKVFGNEISMTRGDTARLTLSLYDGDGKAYEPQEGDRIRFTVSDEVGILISKDITNGEIIIYPNDTVPLDYGVYDYDIQAELGNGDISTAIVSTLTLCKEVTT